MLYDGIEMGKGAEGESALDRDLSDESSDSSDTLGMKLYANIR